MSSRKERTEEELVTKTKDDCGNEVKVTDDKEKAEVFARYFSAVYTLSLIHI